jgi:hypothetical protein
LSITAPTWTIPILSGGGDEIVELTKTNLRDLRPE